MKLNRSIWISITIALVVSILTLAWQRSRISVMRSQLDELESSTTPTPSVTGNKPLGSAAIPSRLEARAGGEPTARRRLSIEELLANIPPQEGFAAFRVVPELLEAVEDYSAGELMAAVREIDELLKRDPSQLNLVSLVTPMLLVAVAEAEPELVFSELTIAG